MKSIRVRDTNHVLPYDKAVDTTAIALIVFLSLLAALPARAADSTQRNAGVGVGADIIVGNLTGVRSYGTSNGISAFAVGTDSCNIGDAPARWIADTPEHPVIAQNAFRLKDQRFEQIGMAWLKHGFAVASANLCGQCIEPSSVMLNPGGSDLYVATLNGNQSFLGPRTLGADAG